MKTRIDFLKSQSDQKKPVLELIKQIQQQANTDPAAMQLFKLIIRGLEFVERHGMPLVKQLYLTTEREDGRPYTIQIVKELRHHVPLMEFRINWVGAGAFRSVFFEHQIGDLQLLLFVTAVVKQTTTSADFEKIVQEAERIYSDFLKNPEQYINLTGVDTHEKR